MSLVCLLICLPDTTGARAVTLKNGRTADGITDYLDRLLKLEEDTKDLIELKRENFEVGDDIVKNVARQKRGWAKDVDNKTIKQSTPKPPSKVARKIPKIENLPNDQEVDVSESTNADKSAGLTASDLKDIDFSGNAFKTSVTKQESDESTDGANESYNAFKPSDTKKDSDETTVNLDEANASADADSVDDESDAEIMVDDSDAASEDDEELNSIKVSEENDSNYQPDGEESNEASDLLDHNLPSETDANNEQSQSIATDVDIVDAADKQDGDAENRNDFNDDEINVDSTTQSQPISEDGTMSDQESQEKLANTSDNIEELDEEIGVKEKVDDSPLSEIENIEEPNDLSDDSDSLNETTQQEATSTGEADEIDESLDINEQGSVEVDQDDQDDNNDGISLDVQGINDDEEDEEDEVNEENEEDEEEDGIEDDTREDISNDEEKYETEE